MSKRMYRAYDAEIYSMVKDLVEQDGLEPETARDRLHGEVDEAVESYSAELEETDE